jgi:hypothetical protein
MVLSRLEPMAMGLLKLFYVQGSLGETLKVFCFTELDTPAVTRLTFVLLSSLFNT